MGSWLVFPACCAQLAAGLCFQVRPPKLALVRGYRLQGGGRARAAGECLCGADRRAAGRAGAPVLARGGRQLCIRAAPPQRGVRRCCRAARQQHSVPRCRRLLDPATGSLRDLSVRVSDLPDSARWHDAAAALAGLASQLLVSAAALCGFLESQKGRPLEVALTRALAKSEALSAFVLRVSGALQTAGAAGASAGGWVGMGPGLLQSPLHLQSPSALRVKAPGAQAHLLLALSRPPQLLQPLPRRTGRPAGPAGLVQLHNPCAWEGLCGIVLQLRRELVTSGGPTSVQLELVALGPAAGGPAAAPRVPARAVQLGAAVGVPGGPAAPHPPPSRQRQCPAHPPGSARLGRAAAAGG